MKGNGEIPLKARVLTEVLPWIILIYLMYLVIKCAVIALVFYLVCLVIKRAFSDNNNKGSSCC